MAWVFFWKADNKIWLWKGHELVIIEYSQSYYKCVAISKKKKVFKVYIVNTNITKKKKKLAWTLLKKI